MPDSKACAINANQNGRAMLQNRDERAFANAEFAQFGALVDAATQSGDAQILAAFGAAQRSATYLVFVVRGGFGAARAENHGLNSEK